MLTRDLKHPLRHSRSVPSGSALSGTTPVAGGWVSMAGTIGPAMAVVSASPATGSPTAQAHVVKIREADNDSGTNATDISGATATITTDGGLVTIQAANRSKPYVQIHITPAFTGGSTPAATACGLIVSQNESY